MIRTYSELIALPTFKERFEYLKLGGKVGTETFGFDRYLNQVLYNSYEWRRTRSQILLRDNGCDLGLDGHYIWSKVIIHHMNPITTEDIEKRNSDIFNPEFLISTSLMTHNAIHYGDYSLIDYQPVERFENDTCPWK